MRYSVVSFEYSFADEWQKDVFEQALADLGFEVFEADAAYIPTNMLDMNALSEVISATEGIKVIRVEDCPDTNWNAVWEKENMPHDLPLDMLIVPDCAFGAGTHATTHMLLDHMLSSGTDFMRSRRVLDNGCGTGILGILAAKLGADDVRAVDMDDKSVASTLANAQRNNVHIVVEQGAMPPKGEYDLIMSNIHRNILLQQMSLYAHFLSHRGELWLSGFYADDCPPLISAAGAEHMRLIEQKELDGWCMLCFMKE